MTSLTAQLRTATPSKKKAAQTGRLLNYEGDTDYYRSSPANTNTIFLGNTYNNSCDWEGLVVWDDLTGGDGNDLTGYLGPVAIETLIANAAGDTEQWSRSSGSNNYEAVDDAAPNFDTDYLYADATSLRELKAYPDLATGQVIKAVVHSPVMRNRDGGGQQIRHVCKSGGTVYQGNPVDCPAGWRARQRAWINDPDTASSWTKSGVDAAQFGIDT